MSKQLLLDNHDVVWVPSLENVEFRLLKYGEGAVLYEGTSKHPRETRYYVMRDDLLIYTSKSLSRAQEEYRAAFFKRESTNTPAPFTKT